MSSQDNAPAKHKKQPGRKKRPRDSGGSSKREEQQQAYYDRLVYQCRKELHKQAKQTKTFFTQKMIRKLKELSAAATALSREQQEQKLQHVKECDLEPVVDECFRRLGLRQLDPKLERIAASKNGVVDLLDPTQKNSGVEGEGEPERQAPESSSPGSQNNISNSPTVPENEVTTTHSRTAVATSLSMDKGWILERILQHKRMVTSLEHWNDQVTEYRRWCLQQQERAEGGVITVTRTKKSRTMDQNNNTSNDINDNALIAADHSVFVMLGGDDGTEDTAAAAHDNYYGPASDGIEPLKKNRKGQRARRAKAQAVEARKTGRVFQPEESLNWRRSRMNHEPQQQQQKRQPDRQHQEAVVAIKPNEDLHPSWQARKEKKDGIVAFQGKKITFD